MNEPVALPRFPWLRVLSAALSITAARVVGGSELACLAAFLTFAAFQIAEERRQKAVADRHHRELMAALIELHTTLGKCPACSNAPELGEQCPLCGMRGSGETRQ